MENTNKVTKRELHILEHHFPDVDFTLMNWGELRWRFERISGASYDFYDVVEILNKVTKREERPRVIIVDKLTKP